MPERDQPHVDPNIDEIFRLTEREIWIITAAAGAERGGCVATFVNRASIDRQRPVISAAIAVNHFTHDLIERSGAFAAHLISANQIELAWRFGIRSGRDVDKFAGVAWRPAATGSPIIESSLAWLDCRVFDCHPGGDRTYFLADVLSGERHTNDTPLTDEQLMGFATPEQKRLLIESLHGDVEIQRPLYDKWRAALPPSPFGRGPG